VGAGKSIAEGKKNKGDKKAIEIKIGANRTFNH